MTDSEIFHIEGDTSLEKKPDENKPDPTLETLNSLKASMEALTGKVTEIENKIPVDTEEEETEEETQHFRPKTWDEIPQNAKEIAEQVIDNRLEEQRLAQEEAQQAKENEAKQLDNVINGQIAELEKSGAIPKIENPNDENDKGRSARRELFGLAARVGTMNLQKAHEVVDILHKSGYTYDARADNFKGAFVKSETTPQGYNSPVAGTKSSFSSSDKPSYEQIQNAGGSLDKLLSMATGE